MRYILILLFSCGFVFGQKATEAADDPYAVVAPVQTQLDGYNTRNIELFLSAYHDSVKVYNFPDKLDYVGKARMREIYAGMFERLEALHCRLVNRIILGNRVFDHESVVFEKGAKPVEIVAMYTVSEGKIIEVRFIRK